MNKIIISAVLAVMATPSMAQTKVYGTLHASFDKVFTVGAKSRNELALNHSIIGVKGSAEIKKHLSFIYQFSWGMDLHDADENGFEDIKKSGFNNRNQVIGLASPKGAVIVGRFDTPFKTLGRKADLFWHSQLGQNRNMTNAQDWDVRADKIIAFQSPKINGFQGSIAYAPDISDTSHITQNASAISLNGFYRKGKFLLGAAYENHDVEKPIANKSANTSAFRLSGVYTDGPLKMVGFYQKEDNDFAVTAKSDANVFGVGIAYKRGDKGTLKAQFYHRNNANNDNSDFIAIGYDYKLSKQLDIYTQAANITNVFTLGSYGLDSASTADAYGVSLGLRIKF